ncbi:MAG: MerR family transcriptional regulator [Halieaceae bacterium]|nr:MerR family transcriptional regulator [Halieaceae bacterium]
MEAQVLEPRPLYGIGTVARLTGLKPDTLRVWERRYGLGASHKSATGRRQYTQADLEHLQLVSTLVKNGSRIGEIAASERKTLEMLLRGQPRNGQKSTAPAGKPRVMVVGDRLCDWLDDHQGCLTSVDAQLARVPLSELDQALIKDESADMLLVDCPTLNTSQVARLTDIAAGLSVQRVVVVYQFGNERWLEELESRDIVTTAFPPDPAFLAFELSRGAADKTVSMGETNLGELIESKPRQFNENELSAARNLKSALDCECPKHIADLIRALNHFEDYSSSCSVENWHDAAVHACIYTYTAQARHLMEKAMQAVLEERGQEFADALAKTMVRNGASKNAA